MDRLDAMEVFLAVVDAGSLSAGSRKLGAPLPSVSRKVAELERFLGTRLLIRTSRNVQLTPAGRDYVDAARQIVVQLNEAERRASGEYEVPRGRLTVTTPLAFGQLCMLPLAFDFLAEHPEVDINVLAVDRVVQLLDEQVDVGLRLGELADSSLYATKVGSFRFLTCASPAYLERKGYPSTPDDLRNHDAAICTTTEEAAWTYERDGQPIQLTPISRFRVNSNPGAVAAAVGGIGIARVPSYMVLNELRTGALVSILDEHDSRRYPVHLVYARQGLLPVKLRVFLDWMAPRLRDMLQEIEDLLPALSA
ncbi:DNA-binding transcriptional LysR family regulator [Sphingomonas leidyi]|uniref:DNA-binding transcriptional LysR family regulator n=1 Tax=Sphingomonas leidyi TaxID=68569 RepID=A0A7X5UYF7_9SPHN|nr:LysR family transcriptional regulator [Sphingomonas leidyi]NIJ64210.1 DNA-binding transcriptional LysR family regulator [Sphingomonas leidyi]